MCMKIITYKKLHRPKVNQDGYCLGYKVLDLNDCSPYQGILYKRGINKSDRESTELTTQETFSGLIRNGFHLFLSLKEAKKEVLEWDDNIVNTKIVKVYFKPEDIVAIGIWDDTGINVRNAVVTKLLIKSLKNIK